jgi:hypothetical protein
MNTEFQFRLLQKIYWGFESHTRTVIFNRRVTHAVGGFFCQKLGVYSSLTASFLPARKGNNFGSITWVMRLVPGPGAS